MRLTPDLHRWDVSPAEAVEIQQRLRSAVVREDRFDAVRLIAGADVGLERDTRTVRAAVVVLTFPGLDPVDQVVARAPALVPYFPGLLSFREAPPVLLALEQLSTPPDLLLCDGQGRAHPRRFGLACHVGLLADLPTVGVAKSRLWGTHGEVPEEKGRWTPLMDGGEVLGAVLRTRTAVRPVYVSTGHRVSLPTAIDLVLRSTTHYRLPETTRRAHRLASTSGS